MSNNTRRGGRHFFDGTGAYIALFLVVTALAVAGYWTLIPHSPTDEPVLDAAPAPNAAPVSPVPDKPKAADTPQQQTPREAAAPVQSAVTVTLPQDEALDLTPTPPSLVVSPLVGETVAAFSMDAPIYSETLGDWRTHDGIDIAADAGTQVCAAASGTVIDLRDDDLMGTSVVLAHDGGFHTIYSNLQSTPTVEVGDYVTAGQVIGSVGKTALSESALAPHLHFGVTHDGEFVDPAAFLD